MSILIKADNIVNKRKEEKERQYGPFDESIIKTAKISSELTNKKFTADDIFKVLIALKLSRMAYNDKEDTYIDMVAYIAALYNYKSKKTKNEKRIIKNKS